MPDTRILTAALALLSALQLRAAADDTAGAALAFARYTTAHQHESPWAEENIEIDASLPKLQQHGRLRAIRRLLPAGKPDYEVLQIDGDRTVKQQVIARYLSAETQAATLPESAVALTPANYKFEYKGTVRNGDRVAYAFHITPRKKRQGLIKGELWLDGETGSIVRESGYLVKNPSIFLKRVAITRETNIHGNAETRITHLVIDTRLVGPAELTIQESPYSSSSTLR